LHIDDAPAGHFRRGLLQSIIYNIQRFADAFIVPRIILQGKQQLHFAPGKAAAAPVSYLRYSYAKLAARGGASRRTINAV
jgi:hypothetical protein